MTNRHPGSFRDLNNGYVFLKKGQLYRLIEACYFANFDHLEKSGLYQKLIEQKLLVTHTVTTRNNSQLIIKPQPIPFISYASEWCFEALRQAALLHLKINLLAIEHQMLLKDASAYNVQFVGNRAIFIDTLSFTLYRQDQPWYAFGQFCRHFIAPLLAMKYQSLTTGKIMTSFIDGLPVELASNLLPWLTHWQPFIKTTVHLHKSFQKKDSRKPIKLPQKSLINLWRYLQGSLQNLNYGKQQTTWANYQQLMNYSPHNFQEKIAIVQHWLTEIKATTIWDLAGNDGYLTKRVTEDKQLVINSDIDSLAINNSHCNNDNILSLIIDLANPTPAYGFANSERQSFLQRLQEAKIDCCLALAIVHHLAINNNIRFTMLAKLLVGLSSYLIIEFVDRQDSWLSKMLSDLRDNRSAFDFYCQNNFEDEFSVTHLFIAKHKLADSNRTLYLLKNL